MRKLDPDHLGKRGNYRILTGSVIPRPIAFVTTLSESGVLNAAPFSYFNVIASDPPMVSISVQRQDGAMKDTARNAENRSAFVVHIADESYISDVNKTARSLPPEESEIALTRLTAVPSDKIKVPGIAEAKIRMECVLERKIVLGETAYGPSCDLLIGRVVQYHIQDDLYEDGRVDARKLAPVSRLSGNAYTGLGDLFELERPK